MLRFRNSAGFTLIELLISIVIIGLLAAIALNVFWSAKDRGLEAAMKSDLRTAAVQQERYHERNFSYSADPAVLADFTLSPGVSLSINYAQGDGWGGVATHPGLTLLCGMFVGGAPASSGFPATRPGIIHCQEP
jgi:prepilin-type N-terminal cleavage/methylation domain-containing protein